MITIQRRFIPGDQWVFFKIYTGFKTADQLLKDVIPIVTSRLLAEHIIYKWFFIRYSDPELHLRLRFLLVDTAMVSLPVIMLNEALQPFIRNDLVWKLQLDTYQREIERYGAETMELSESLFFYDSQYFTRILSCLKGEEAENDRWLMALASIDGLLNDFSFDLHQKVAYVSMVKDNFVREFGLGNSRSQLSDKYRAYRKVVEAILEAKEERYLDFYRILEERSIMQKPIADQIMGKIDNDEKLKLLLSSYTHLMINRWFRSKQRMHEAVVYDFLLKYYKSKMAWNGNKN